MEPFRIHVPTSALNDLAERLAHVRWPDQPTDSGWADGTELDYLRDLAEHWQGRFDWRAQERRLNRLHQYRAQVGGLGIHFVHEAGAGPDPMPLLLTHGWPSTFAEPANLVPRLTDPTRFGADPADSFDVVIPSLPGYGFSDRPTTPDVAHRIPALWVDLMRQLGYERFAAHGTDIGAFVTNRLGFEHADRLVGIHVSHWVEPGVDPADLSKSEREFVAGRAVDAEAETAYAHVQRTKPQTLAYALTDSPVGLAAWIVEKWRAWSDCGGHVERRFSKDELLTTVSIYWHTNTVASSIRLYKQWALGSRPLPSAPIGAAPVGAGESTPLPAGRRIEVPARLALFGPTHNPPPDSWLHRGYTEAQIARMPRGGHFPALEEPDLLADDLRTFFRPLRRRHTASGTGTP